MLYEEIDDSATEATTSQEECRFEENESKPNDQTQAALSEYMEMLNNPYKCERYRSAKEMLDDVLSDT